MNALSSPKSTPKDVFLHLLGIVVLFIAIISLLTLIFQYVEIKFPDQLDPYRYGSLQSIRWSSSALIVVWPVYILLAWLIGRDLRSLPERREMKIRKWLLYLMLFVASITIIVDLIILLNSFFGGELTVRFLFKTITVLIVAGAVFGYFIWDLRRTDRETSKTPKKLAWIVSVILLAIIILGFFVIGSPAKQRKIQLDEQRINHLSNMQYQIADYYRANEKLPESYGQSTTIDYIVPQTDPETNETYLYNKTGDLTFELCATFSTDSSDLPPAFKNPSDIRDFGIRNSQDWEHPAGKHCFERTVDPERIKNSEGIYPRPVYD